MGVFDICGEVVKASEKALSLCSEKFAEIEAIQEYNQQKMIKAFQLAGVRESHFAATTGYGYDDAGTSATCLQVKSGIYIAQYYVDIMPINIMSINMTRGSD